MQNINIGNLHEEIREIIFGLKLILNNKNKLKNLEKIDIDILADQLLQDYKNGSNITKTYIKLCIYNTLNYLSL